MSHFFVHSKEWVVGLGLFFILLSLRLYGTPPPQNVYWERFFSATAIQQELSEKYCYADTRILCAFPKRSENQYKTPNCQEHYGKPLIWLWNLKNDDSDHFDCSWDVQFRALEQRFQHLEALGDRSIEPQTILAVRVLLYTFLQIWWVSDDDYLGLRNEEDSDAVIKTIQCYLKNIATVWLDEGESKTNILLWFDLALLETTKPTGL